MKNQYTLWLKGVYSKSQRSSSVTTITTSGAVEGLQYGHSLESKSTITFEKALNWLNTKTTTKKKDSSLSLSLSLIQCTCVRACIRDIPHQMDKAYMFSLLFIFGNVIKNHFDDRIASASMVFIPHPTRTIIYLLQCIVHFALIEKICSTLVWRMIVQ